MDGHRWLHTVIDIKKNVWIHGEYIESSRFAHICEECWNSSAPKDLIDALKTDSTL